jgi:hypothetical protein
MSLTILSMAPHASATTWPCLAVVMDICIWWIWSQAKQMTSLEVATYIAGSVTVADGLAYTGDYDGLFSCIDLNKKKLKWQFDNPSSNLPIIASPAVSNKKVVIGGQDKYLRCFDDQWRTGLVLSMPVGAWMPHRLL